MSDISNLQEDERVDLIGDLKLVISINLQKYLLQSMMRGYFSKQIHYN